jgi:hypothetical protein
MAIQQEVSSEKVTHDIEKTSNVRTSHASDVSETCDGPVPDGKVTVQSILAIIVSSLVFLLGSEILTSFLSL